MKFFERFGSSGSSEKKDSTSSNLNSANESLREAMKSHNATVAEIAENRRAQEEQGDKELLGIRAEGAAASAKLQNIEIVRESSALKARNQLAWMKLKHLDSRSEEFLKLHAEIETNTKRIAELDAIVESAVAEAEESIYKGI